MSDLARLAREAAGFDDDAIVALANPGLARRGRRLLDSEAPTVHEDHVVTVRGPDWAVTIATGAPLVSARCNCATSGVCQHIVAVILLLRDSQGAKSTRPSSPTTEPRPASIAGVIGGLPEEGLRRWCGAGDWRWALDRLAALDEGDVGITESAQLVVTMPPPLPTVRFTAASVDAAIVDPSGRHDRRVIALAALCLWRAAGRSTPTAPARDTPSPPVAGREEVLRDVDGLVGDMLTEGLIHLPGAVVQQLDALAASARGARWYRIANLAERSADELEGIERRDASADGAVLLDLMAELAAVAEAIRTRLAQAEPVPEALAGVARAAYDAVGDLELIGCGHASWGDAIFGGTVAVLAPARSDQLVSVSVARTIRGTTASADVGWSGAGSIEALAGAVVHLTGAKLSADRRLSTSSATTAVVQTEAGARLIAASAWGGDEPEQPSRLRGRNGWRWVVAAIDDAGQSQFDPVSQTLRWPIRSAGQTVEVALPFHDRSASAVDSIERLIPLAPSHVIGRLTRGASDSGLTLQPISAVVSGQLNVLASTTAPPSPKPRRRAPERAVPAAAPHRFGHVAAALMRAAERGAHPGRPREVAQLADHCEDRGLTSLAAVLRSQGDDVARILRAAWVLAEHRQVGLPAI